MKPFNSLQLQLIEHLSDGNCHSGSVIGEKLSVSRTAIWKQIRQLIALGLKIKRIPQQGYLLQQPFIPLNEHSIRKQLNLSAFNKPIHFHLFTEIDSTNHYLKTRAISEKINICAAETQTAGRGRFGRQWLSPFGENIYLSMHLELQCCLSKLSGLSLIVGLAILEGLKNCHIEEEIRIKWPNDLYWNHKKLCGILIEVIAETNACAKIIIGIGLNVNTDTQSQQLPDRPWCSLYELTGKYSDRNKIISEILNSINKNIDQFLQYDFSFFQERWQKIDYLAGHPITISHPRGSMSGYAHGVNDFGQLCLIDEKEKVHFLSSGDTTLHKEGFVPS